MSAPTLSDLDDRLPTPALVDQLTALLTDLVREGAALGWTDPPARQEIETLLSELYTGASRSDAAAVLASEGEQLLGFGCWRRYDRPTHRPHADLPYLAVTSDHHGRGLGGQLLDELIARAHRARIEQLTLDARGDNLRAHALWRSRGFVQYGTLPDFVAVGERRYDKTFWTLDLRRRTNAPS